MSDPLEELANATQASFYRRRPPRRSPVWPVVVIAIIAAGVGGFLIARLNPTGSNVAVQPAQTPIPITPAAHTAATTLPVMPSSLPVSEGSPLTSASPAVTEPPIIPHPEVKEKPKTIVLIPDFDSDHAREEIKVLNEIIARDENTKANAAENTNTQAIDANLKSCRADLTLFTQKYIAWSDALPSAQDLPASLKGKTLEEAESFLGTKVNPIFISNSVTRYQFQSQNYGAYFEIPTDGTITKVTVFPRKY